jgi:uncharacterized membrane protein YhaH (DUF805 family)
MGRKETKGIATSEFWVSIGAGIMGVIAALVALIVGLQYVDEQTGNLIIGVATSIVGLAVTVLPAYIAVRYTQSRAEIKKS